MQRKTILVEKMFKAQHQNNAFTSQLAAQHVKKQLEVPTTFPPSSNFLSFLKIAFSTKSRKSSKILTSRRTQQALTKRPKSTPALYSFCCFGPVTQDQVNSVSLKSAPKHCELDPLLTPLLLECLAETLATSTQIISHSLVSGMFPSTYKTANVKPLIKKPSLDQNDFKNYRPVSNRSFISKVLGTHFISQLSGYLNQMISFAPLNQHIALGTALRLRC